VTWYVQGEALEGSESSVIVLTPVAPTNVNCGIGLPPDVPSLPIADTARKGGATFRLTS